MKVLISAISSNLFSLSKSNNKSEITKWIFSHSEFLLSKSLAKNLLSKFNPETTAVVYIFGAKDAGRLSGGKYFQNYKKNKNNLKGYEDNGYVLTAPHVSLSVCGKEVIGSSPIKGISGISLYIPSSGKNSDPPSK